MKKLLLLVASLAFVILAVFGFASCTSGSGTVLEGLVLSNQEQGIIVSGEGKVSAAPDVATISMGIEAQALTVVEAQAQAADAMNKVIQALKDDGVADNDIQTQYFSISPVTRWDESQQREITLGYRVSNTVIVKIRNIGAVGPIIDNVVTAGGDLTRINGISFSVDDPTSYYNEARKEAVVNAAAKAQQLADLTGVTLGKPMQISESSGYYPPPIYMKGGAMDSAASTPIVPGEVDITLSVQIAYAIK